MKYKKLKIVFLLGFVYTGLQAQTMYVKETSGTQTNYPLNNIQTLTFSGGSLLVHNNSGSPDTYLLSGIRYLNFVDLTTEISITDKSSENILFYPNPVIDVLNVQLPTGVSQSLDIEVISIDGRVIYKERSSSTTAVYQINVSALPKGIYICKLNYETNYETFKFLK